MTEYGDPTEGGSWRAPGCDTARSPAVAGLRARLSSVLDELGELSLTGLAEADVVDLVDTLTTVTDRVAAQTCRAVVEADRRRVGDATGCRNTVQWWTMRSRLTRGQAGRLLSQGLRLDDDLHAPVRVALAAGDVRVEQAAVITSTVDGLPPDVTTPQVRRGARDLLLTEAKALDARDLRILGKRVLDVLAPEIGESHEQRLLEAEEAAAAAAARFTMVDDGHGRCHGRFTLPSLHGRMLTQHLHTLADPRRHRDDLDPLDPSAPPRPVVTPELLGQALMEYVEAYPVDRLPDPGGIGATLTITMDLAKLRSGLGVAALPDGTRLSAGETRRIACRAGLVPMVLDGASVPLDLGHTHRLASPGQRRALLVRDKECTTQGCRLPASVCHAHHDQPWSQGGRTDLADLRLLCPRHHRIAHHPRYDTAIHPDNTVTFHRRT